jgi:hypothetical protein
MVKRLKTKCGSAIESHTPQLKPSGIQFPVSTQGSFLDFLFVQQQIECVPPQLAVFVRDELPEILQLDKTDESTLRGDWSLRHRQRMRGCRLPTQKLHELARPGECEIEMSLPRTGF